jgi:hypothetical protein
MEGVRIVSTTADPRVPTDAGDLLLRAFRISLRNPLLWVLPLLGAIPGQMPTIVNLLISGPEGLYAPSGPAMAMRMLPFLLLLIPVAFVAALWADAALQRGIDAVASGRRGAFGEWVAGGGRALFRYIGFILIGIPLALLCIAPPIPGVLLLIAHKAALGAMFLVIGLLFTLVLAFVVGLTWVYGSRAVVLEGAGPIRGWQEGFRILTDRPGRSILLAILFVMITLALGMVLVMVMLLVMIPVFIAGAAFQGESSRLPPAVILPIFLVLLPISAWMNTFGGSVWTLAYRWARPWPPAVPDFAAGPPPEYGSPAAAPYRSPDPPAV